MRKSLLTLMGALAVAIFVNAAASAQVGQAQRITGDRFTVSGRTPMGVNIYAVRRPSPAMLTAIDRGFSDLFAIARRHGYTRGLNHGSYTVFIGNADRTRSAAGTYSPDIAVRAAQYAGSEYDQGGFVYAAGMVLSFSPMSFVIAEHTRDFNRVSDVVRYEGEHLVLYHNDRRRYSQTADHSRGGGHPILQ